MTSEPFLLNSMRVLALTTMGKVKEMNKEVFDGMVEVERWMPSDGTYDGLSLVKEKKVKKRTFYTKEHILKPIIKDVNVTWGYRESDLKDAIKIMAILRWDNPKFLGPKEPFPMIIKTGIIYNNPEIEPVIMIAPHIMEE